MAPPDDPAEQPIKCSPEEQSGGFSVGESREPSDDVFDASAELREALARHRIHLAPLVAELGLWASPEVHRRLLSLTGSAAWFPTIRRLRPGQGEEVGRSADGGRLDNNS